VLSREFLKRENSPPWTEVEVGIFQEFLRFFFLLLFFFLFFFFFFSSSYTYCEISQVVREGVLRLNFIIGNMMQAKNSAESKEHRGFGSQFYAV
jgi:hypothetical protein